MQVSSSQGSGVGGASMQAAVSTLKKANEQQGQQAVQLIDSATQGNLATSGQVGTRLHVVA